MFAWVLFRADNLSIAIDYWKAMFRFTTNNEQMGIFMNNMNPEFYTAFIIAILGALGFFGVIGRKLDVIFTSNKTGSTIFSYSFHVASITFYVMILFLCSLYLIAGTYNPFIYYRF